MWFFRFRLLDLCMYLSILVFSTVGLEGGGRLEKCRTNLSLNYLQLKFRIKIQSAIDGIEEKMINGKMAGSSALISRLIFKVFFYVWLEKVGSSRPKYSVTG
uniref:Secreted protein n=1 Tax=Micrurus lemniscatus lemniscatus TaxID=129467 RepID=A0A2D4IXT0_MICLE